MRLLPPTSYSDAFEPYSSKTVAYVINHYGNAGDEMIHLATLQMYSYFSVDYFVANPSQKWDGRLGRPADAVFLYGGGNMGYPASGHIRAKAKRIPLPKILLPQSWRQGEDAPYDRVFARERYSIEVCPGAEFMPDLALGLDCPEPPPAREGLGVLLRADREGLFGGKDDPAAKARDAATYLELAGNYATIITDRLHFAISGLLNRRKVILLPNVYHKNKGVYEASLRDLGCLWADTPAKAMGFA